MFTNVLLKKTDFNNQLYLIQLFFYDNTIDELSFLRKQESKCADGLDSASSAE